LGKTTCPHCGRTMQPIETPMDSSWGGEIHEVCFNDECTYFVRSFEFLEAQGIEGAGYRCRCDARGRFGAIPITCSDDLKTCIVTEEHVERGTLDFFDVNDFRRVDDTPDEEFYAKPGIVDHMDSFAAKTVQDLYVRLIPEKAKVLDLMAGTDSHLSPDIRPEKVTGLGLNTEELAANTAMTEKVIHNLNANPTLPFEDNSFDAVINTVSIDYMTRPVEVFKEVARILKNSGIFVVVFSNRMFPPKAVDIWKRSTEMERVELVKKFFSLAEKFYLDGFFESKGHPRPVDDKFYSLGIPSDPIYAVWGKTVK
jgi:SAM-dependent methyltransferase